MAVLPRRWRLGRNDRFVRSEVLPDKRKSEITGCVLGLSLINLNFGYFESRTFGGQDRLKVHLIAGDEDDRNVETFTRVVRLNVCLERPQICEPPFLELNL